MKERIFCVYATSIIQITKMQSLPPLVFSFVPLRGNLFLPIDIFLSKAEEMNQLSEAIECMRFPLFFTI